MIDDDDVIIAKDWLIYEEEKKILNTRDLYLVTWSPDPKQLPDTDFTLQHKFNVNLLSQLLRTVRCGLFCVESTAMGNPHYHGWYQDEPPNELARIAIIKVLQRFGNLKITSGLHYKVDRYYSKGNCLHYYKKDTFDSMLLLPIISASSYEPLDWVNPFLFFGTPSMHMAANAKTLLIEKASEISQVIDFYKSSL